MVRNVAFAACDVLEAIAEGTPTGNSADLRPSRRSDTVKSWASALSDFSDTDDSAERTASVEDYQLDASDEGALPCLLSALRRGQKGKPIFKVKNTFIEGLVEDEDTSPEMGRRRTCPEKFEGAGVSAEARLDCPAVTKQVRVAADFRGGVADAAVDLAPLEARQPQPSLGSTQHEEGACRPCAWFWRPQGCTNGFECRHCHLCTPNEVKARRKAKRTNSSRLSQVQKEACIQGR